MTEHRIITGDSTNMEGVADGSIDLVVTSPPYPMIGMWDEMFAERDPEISKALACGNGIEAFDQMHKALDTVWSECDRVLAKDRFVCINIGDAVRTINGKFQLYPNHAHVIEWFLRKGYSVLPDIHWRKHSNSPNKFMGSGMYPAGAYVTYEHEYVLIFRKGGKRQFDGSEKTLRQKSAYFWEERNTWFSDLWEIGGTSQNIADPGNTRGRSASFPLEIPYRLVNMYSVEGDTVLDPFAGLGTTNIACMIANRNSIGVELDPEIARLALERMDMPLGSLNGIIRNRIQQHPDFVNGYTNAHYGFGVKTKQETAIRIDELISKERHGDRYICEYEA